MTRIRNSLQSRLGNTPWDEQQLKDKAKRLWHESNGQTVMVRLDWIQDSLDKQMLLNFGNITFGKVDQGKVDG